MSKESDIFTLFEVGKENTGGVGLLKNEKKTKSLSKTLTVERDKTRTPSLGKGKIGIQHLIMIFNYHLICTSTTLK